MSLTSDQKNNMDLAVIHQQHLDCANPNLEPSLFCCNKESVGSLQPTRTYLVFDVSASQGNGFDSKDPHRGDYLVSTVLHVERKDLMVVPFGFFGTTRVHPNPYDQPVTNPYCPSAGVTPLSILQFQKLLPTYRFPTATSTTLIRHFFEHDLDIETPCHLVFEGDGVFSETNFLQILHDNHGKFTNVISLTLVFSPHTAVDVRKTLEQDVGALLEQCDSFIEFKSVQLDRADPFGLQHVLVDLSEQEVVMGPEWLIYRQLCIHRDLVPASIASLLRTRFAAMLPQLVQDMVDTLRHRPELFQSDRNVYSKLYATLKLLRTQVVPKVSIQRHLIQQLGLLALGPPTVSPCNQDVKVVISLLRSFPAVSNDLDDYEAWVLQTIDTALIDTKTVSAIFNSVKSTLSTVSTQGTVATELFDWLSTYLPTLRADDGHRRSIDKLLRDARVDPAESKWAVYQLERIRVGYLHWDAKFVAQCQARVMPAIQDGSGILLAALIRTSLIHLSYQSLTESLDPHHRVSVPDHQQCSPQQARVALGQLLTPLGQFTLMGKKLYISLVTILVEDVEVNDHLWELVARAMLDHEEYTLQMLFKPQQGELEDLWYSPKMARLLFRAIILFGDRMFPLSHHTPEHQQRLVLLKTLYKAHWFYRRFANVVSSEHASLTVTRQEPDTSDQQTHALAVGAICRVHDTSWGDKNCTKSSDPLPNLPSLVVVRTGTKKRRQRCEYLDSPLSSRDTQYIKPVNLQVLAFQSSAALMDRLNQQLMQWRQDDENENESKIDPALLSQRWDLVNQMITIAAPAPCKMVTKTIQVTLPTRLIADMLPLAPLFRDFLVANQRFNQRNIGPFLHQGALEGDPIENKEWEFESGRVYYTVPDHVVTSLQTAYKYDSDFASSIRGSTASKLVTCYICKEPVIPEGTRRLPCGHSYCLECNPAPVYQRGEFFNPARHLCAFCPDVWVQRATDDQSLGPDFKYNPNLTYRFCRQEGCSLPFGTLLRCRATRADVPDFCEQHRSLDQPRTCPHCEAMTVRIDGCNHIHCQQCGEHWCWLDRQGGFYDDYNNVGDSTLPGIYAFMMQKYGGYFTRE
jgi:hypothetical protein